MDKYICCQGGIKRVIRCRGLQNGRNPSDSRVLAWGSGKVVELFNNLWRKTEGLVLRTR